MNEILLFIGGGLTMAWGVAHLFPTKNVVKGFGNITEDNKKVITMEWIVEGVSLLFFGALVIIVTLIDYATVVSTAVYYTVAVGLIALAGVSLFTGFKVRFLPYRLCPVIFTASAVLIILGNVL